MNENLIDDTIEALREYIRTSHEAERLKSAVRKFEAKMTLEEREEYSKRIGKISQNLQAQADALKAESDERFKPHAVK